MALTPYPTKRQEEALRDVLDHPGASLAERAARLDITRAGVLGILRSLGAKTLALPDAKGKWTITRLGRKWLYPTMPTRHAKDEAR